MLNSRNNQLNYEAIKKMAGLKLMSTVFLLLTSCGFNTTEPSRPVACSTEWFGYVETKLRTSDDEGHGPDLGSLEWRHTVQFRLELSGEEEIPNPESSAWCQFIDHKLDTMRLDEK